MPGTLVIVPVENAAKQYDSAMYDEVFETLKREEVVTIPVPESEIEKLVIESVFVRKTPVRVFRDGQVSFNSKNKHSWMSNFYPVPFKLMDELYRTVEHFYQSQKTQNVRERLEILNARKAAGARRKGRSVSLAPNWNTIRNTVMLTGLRLKFTHPRLAVRLIATGNARLIHEAPWDDYWGTGKNGNGKNRLGELLGVVRTALINALGNNHEFSPGYVFEEDGWFVGVVALTELLGWRNEINPNEFIPAEFRGAVLTGAYLTGGEYMRRVREAIFEGVIKLRHFLGTNVSEVIKLPGELNAGHSAAWKPSSFLPT